MVLKELGVEAVRLVGKIRDLSRDLSHRIGETLKNRSVVTEYSQALGPSQIPPPENFPVWPMPKSGFFQAYLSWAVPRTEAPAAFHVATALVAAAIVLGRKCAVKVGDLTLHPNIYAILVGESTLVRKTHALSMQRRILQKAEEIIQPDNGFYFADDGTPEGLLLELAEQGRGIKAFNEFGAFLKKIKKRDYMGSFAGFLTELYDCPPQYRKRLAEKSYTVEAPFLCIEGATTREWLVDAMDESDIQSGFLARFLFFSADDKIELIPITPLRDEKAERRLAEELAKLYEVGGTFEPTVQAKEIYKSWYIKHRQELKAPGMSLLSSYYGRLEGYVWKIALIFEAVTNSRLTSISEGSTKLAIQLVERLKERLRPLILKDFQPSEWSKKVHKVRRLIKGAGMAGIGRSPLLRNSHLRAHELNEVLGWLQETEEIRSDSAAKGSFRYFYLKKKS